MHFPIKERTLSGETYDTVLPTPADGVVAERLSVLVGPTLAKKTLSKLGVHGIARRSVDEIVAEVGVTRKVATRIVAARELADALSPKRPSIMTPKCVKLELPLGFERFEREVMLAFALNSQCERIATILVAAGGASLLCITPRDVLRPLIRVGAAATIVVHCHPGGSPEPSEADIAFCNALYRACAACAIDYLDNVIVAEGGMTSFHEFGLMPTLEELERRTPS
ncbi:MAG: JAB domain-containing protein [Polyangiaceae bacterium]